jgi:GWxTD domain-containing protein
MTAKFFRNFSLIACCCLASCFGSKNISNMNMVSQYRGTEQLFHPEFTVFNEEDSAIRIWMKVHPDEFLFVRQSDESYKSFISVFFELTESYESSATLDSMSSVFSFDLSEKIKSKNISVRMPSRSRGNLLLRCIITDLNKNTRDYFYTRIDRASKPSRNDFLISDKNGIPLYRNYIASSDTFTVSYKDTTVKKFWCKYYHREFLLAPPPFSFDIHDAFNYHPDSLFQVDISMPLNFLNEGFYHFQLDTTIKDGLTLFRFDPGFPVVSSPQQMLQPLRYLNSKKEFEELAAAPSLKAALENFWLVRGGNQDKTRSLIKKYYGRVQEANRYFTSHTQGWRTDRGMIYVVLGSPSTVYRSSVSESWIYGSPNSALALNFFFSKVDNPFTDNDFTLSRAPIYESVWYRAVETWRQGRAYNSFY